MHIIVSYKIYQISISIICNFGKPRYLRHIYYVKKLKFIEIKGGGGITVSLRIKCCGPLPSHKEINVSKIIPK